MLQSIPHHPTLGMQALVIPKAVTVLSGIASGFEWRETSSAALDAFIDTGAARSCIPRVITKRDDGKDILRPIEYGRPADWNGIQAAVDIPIFMIRLSLGGFGPFEICPYETGARQFIVGRDILSRLFTALDGPTRRLRVRPSAGALDCILRRIIKAP